MCPAVLLEAGSEMVWGCVLSKAVENLDIIKGVFGQRTEWYFGINTTISHFPFLIFRYNQAYTVLFFRGYSGVCILLNILQTSQEKNIHFTILKLMPYKFLKTKSYVNIATLLLCVVYIILLCVIVILIAAPSLLAAFWHNFFSLRELRIAISRQC